MFGITTEDSLYYGTYSTAIKRAVKVLRGFSARVVLLFGILGREIQLLMYTIRNMYLLCPCCLLALCHFSPNNRHCVQGRDLDSGYVDPVTKMPYGRGTDKQ